MKAQKENQSGITLVALIVSIIVMLILAGVSLNMTVGDNGIISQAQSATYQDKCAKLEEYLNQYYVMHFDDFENRSSKIAAIKSLPESSSWIYPGILGYVIDIKGNIHYFLDCDNLNKEMQDIIQTWSHKDYADYVNCKDVYGVTEDLHVYYCNDGTDNMIGVNSDKLTQEDGDKEVFGAGSSYAKLLTGDSQTALTTSDIRGITTLDLNDSTGITNLNDLYNFIALDKLTLNGMTLESLDGLEYATNINAIFIQNCKINDYSAIAKLKKINYLFLLNADDEEVRKLCDSTVGIGGKDVTSLRYFGIYGEQAFTFRYTYHKINNSQTHNSFSRVDYLSNLSVATKESITNLFLNNNSLTNVDNLYQFKNVTRLRVEGNQITNLSGLYYVDSTDPTKNTGMVLLNELHARYNQLGKGIEGTGINPSVDSLNHFSKATLGADSKYTFSVYLTNLGTVDLAYNTSLKWIDYLKPCTTISTLYLDGCTGLDNSSLINTASIINKANTSLSKDQQFYIASSDNTITRLDISGRTMTKKAFEDLLDGKSKLLFLRLDNIDIKANDNSVLDAETYNEMMNTVLGKLTTLKFLYLYNLPKVTTVDFAQYTTQLFQLDLRGTGATDLSKINTYCTKLNSLFINNDGITVADIQDAYNRVSYETSTNETLYSDRGIMLGTEGLVRQLADCTRITRFVQWGNTGRNQTETYDLTKCSGLLNGTATDNPVCVLSGTIKIKLPTHLTRIGNDYGGFQCEYEVVNASQLVNLQYLSTAWDADWKFPKNLANALPNLQTLDFYGAPSVAKINGLTNPTKYKSLRIYGFDGNKESASLTETNLEGLENFTNLESLYLYYNKKLTRIPPQVENLTKLKVLHMSETNVTNLYAARNLKDLYYINVQNTPMYETGFYTALDGSTGTCNNMDIIKDLHGESLTQIYLRGTQITDFSSISNLSWAGKSGF